MRIGSIITFISSHLISGSSIGDVSFVTRSVPVSRFGGSIGDVPFVTRSVPVSRLRQVTLLVTEGHS